MQLVTLMRLRMNSRMPRLALMTLLIALPSTGTAQTTRPCLAPDQTASRLIDFGVSLVTDSSAGAQALRSKFGITATTAADVALVQDDAVCEAATAGMDRVATPSSEAYVVVRIGQASPVYLLTRRSPWLFGDAYLLNAQFVMLTGFR
jgi:hypothetical protein